MSAAGGGLAQFHEALGEQRILMLPNNRIQIKLSASSILTLPNNRMTSLSFMKLSRALEQQDQVAQFHEALGKKHSHAPELKHPSIVCVIALWHSSYFVPFCTV
jgi:hypothetical protein